MISVARNKPSRPLFLRVVQTLSVSLFNGVQPRTAAPGWAENGRKTAVSGALYQREAELVCCGVMERPPLKPGLELRVCKPPGVGATVREY